ncbi:MAG: hypothetical protein ACRBN8_38620 [Nannocystales bacterium]
MARSRAYPISSLGKAVEDLETLTNQLGAGLHDRAAIGQALGYKGGTGKAARRVAALVQYGLIDRKKDGYEVAPAADEVLHPTDDEEKRQALHKAFFNVSLFAELVEKYKPGGRLPQQLENLLYRNHRITAAAKDEVAEIFRVSARFAGVISEDDVFTRGGTTEHDLVEESAADDEEPGESLTDQTLNPAAPVPGPAVAPAPAVAPPDPVVGPSAPTGALAPPPVPAVSSVPAAASVAGDAGGYQLLRVSLSSGTAQLSFPNNLTAHDLKKLKKLIEVVALDVEEEAGA